jgi:hypothetical protein
VDGLELERSAVQLDVRFVMMTMMMMMMMMMMTTTTMMMMMMILSGGWSGAGAFGGAAGRALRARGPDL